jgi:flagellar protein FlaF
VNTTMMARSAYAASANPARTPRGTEYEAFARITARLRAASLAGTPGIPALADALHENRRLWTILASDVAESGNGLSPDLRARIFYLAEFTLQHTSRVLAGDGDAAILVDINTAIMGGLRNERSAA